MADISIKPYNASLKKEWNDFVESSKNGTFLFNRGFMDYHSERFADSSFIFYKKGKLYSLLPANVRGDVIYSHQGLTYGGLVMNDECTATGILEVFETLRAECKRIGVKKIVYKRVPYIYDSLPSEEDLYALFRYDAKLIARTISTTIDRLHPLELSQLRKRLLKKAQNFDIRVTESTDLESFYKILESNLRNKYGVSPVHSLEELKLLQSRFPDNIKLFSAHKDGEMLAGGLFFVTKEVVHAQYPHASQEGKKIGAMDILFNYVINNEFPGVRYFDFGHSTEQEGRYLNENLIFMKQGFGGRAICYDTYELTF